MINYIIYSTINGEILRTGVTPELEQQVINPSEAALEGMADGRTQYVVDGAVVDRPENPTTVNKTEVLADGVDAFAFSNYPASSVIMIEGNLRYFGVLAAGADDFVTSYPGAYTVTVFSFPYLDKEFTINASES